MLDFGQYGNWLCSGGHQHPCGLDGSNGEHTYKNPPYGYLCGEILDEKMRRLRELDGAGGLHALQISMSRFQSAPDAETQLDGPRAA